MCGIWVSLGPKVGRVHLDCIRHRGPDDDGWEQSEEAGLWLTMGHRRLSIVDLSVAGHQPMTSHEGDHSIVFNGEIYNHHALRSRLERHGFRARSTCDTEVLLELFARRDLDCLGDLDGMFAFVVLDRRRRRLTAVRDRFGIKPLYVLERPGEIAFASEIKQFLGLPGFRPRLDAGTAFDFLDSGSLDLGEGTMFEGVRQLQPGTFMQIDLDTREARNRRWYSLPSPGSLRLPQAEATETYGRMLAESVQAHMLADVEVGSCLSGGLDSTSIVCLMREAAGRQAPISTVHASFPGSNPEETRHAEIAAGRAGTELIRTTVVPEEVDSLLRQVTWHQDEPVGDLSIMAQWRVFETAREAGIKVMLDGQGADEPLGGYHSCIPIRMGELLRGGRYAEYLRELVMGRRRHGLPVSKEIARRVLPDRLTRAMRHGQAHRRALETSSLFADLSDRRSREAGSCTEDRRAPGTELGSWCHALTERLHLPRLLHWEDRNSMAHSIEARVPFLDHRLVEFSIALGGEHKIVEGRTKNILRNSMAARIPESIRDRHDKVAFATPQSAWLRGPLDRFLDDAISRTLDGLPGLIDRGRTHELTEQWHRGRNDLEPFLWRVAAIGIWADAFGIES